MFSEDPYRLPASCPRASITTVAAVTANSFQSAGVATVRRGTPAVGFVPRTRQPPKSQIRGVTGMRGRCSIAGLRVALLRQHSLHFTTRDTMSTVTFT